MAVLRELDRLGAHWNNGEKPTRLTLKARSKVYNGKLEFPYVIYSNNDEYVNWDYIEDLDTQKVIAFDGRKEEQMSEKYVVSQEFMNDVRAWKGTLYSSDDEYKPFVGIERLENLPEVVFEWLASDVVADEESNNRLIAIIRWVNGEPDVFEVEKPKKWVVRSLETVNTGDYGYVSVNAYNVAYNTYRINVATKFDTKEEAQEWCNSHQEVIEVEDEQ